MSEQTAVCRIPITPDPSDRAEGLLPDNLDHDFPVWPGDTPEGAVEKIGSENGGGEYVPDPPTIPNEMEAERHLKAVSHYRREEKRLREHAAAHRAQIDEWERDRLRPINARIAWHEGGLRAWFRTVRRKSIKLVYGTVKLVTGRERVEVVDEDALREWARQTDTRGVFRIKEEPDKTLLRALIKQNGEMPDGVDLVIGEDTVRIETV